MLHYLMPRKLNRSITLRHCRSLSDNHGLLTVDNPYSGETVVQIPYTHEKEAMALLQKSSSAQKYWASSTTLDQRQSLCRKWMEVLHENRNKIAVDITRQMGKPLKQALAEINGTLDRAKVLIELSSEALVSDLISQGKDRFQQITKAPVGVVFVLAPWNYPLMTAVNSIIPAVLAGNSVVLKHSPRTPLCGNHYEETFLQSGFPDHLVSALHCQKQTAAAILKQPEIGFVSFTGSVNGGRQIQRIESSKFIANTLELGGKDAAYVACDADIDHAAASIVDGAFYNAGQSCCALERVYVHKSKYNEFLQIAKQHIDAYKIGDPMQEATTLGPIAENNQIDFLEHQVNEAVKVGGGTILTNSGCRTQDMNNKGRFFLPCMLGFYDISSDLNLSILKEESFGPVLPVIAIDSDESAVEHMNSTEFGLTSAIYSQDKDRCLKIGSQLDCGTIFMNRSDCLDPYLPWAGWKSSGKGASLSKYGFLPFTRFKSFNFNIMES